MEPNIQQEIMRLNVAEARSIIVGGQSEPETRWKAVWNVNTNKVASIVSDGYEIVQHRDVASSFLEACQNLNIENEMSIKEGGNRMFIDVKFPQAKLYVQKGEEFIAGFRLINSYDKSTGIIIVPRLVRLVCQNGMVMPVKGFIGSFCYRHNQNMAKNIHSYIEKAIAQTIESSEKLKAMVNNCIGDSVEWEIAEKIMEALIHVEKHYKPMVAIMKQKYEATGKKLTRWDVYNAITQYTSHGEQLKPRIEELLQKKAQRVLVTPMIKLAEIIPKKA